MKLTKDEIIKATGAKIVRDGSGPSIRGVSIDSRTMKRGNLFIAIKGDRFDGHAFVNQAIKKGASAVMVSNRGQRYRAGVPILCVSNTIKALGQLAGAHREKFRIPIIAITGSTGKTTTKEMIADILATRYTVLRTTATQNNHIGVPLALLRLGPKHQIAVLELGSNRPGDINWLAQVAHPTVAVFTNVGESHLQKLKTTKGVLKEKLSLLKGLDTRGTIIINRDDPHLARIKSSLGKQKMIGYGVRRRSVFHASDIRLEDNHTLTFKLNRRHFFRLPTSVHHNIYNAIAAISCSRLFKISYNDMQRVLSRFAFPDGRTIIRKIKRYWVIDDTYNANPISFKSAIDTLSRFRADGRKIIVCGDMLELGAKSKNLHGLVGRWIAGSNCQLVLTYGRQARHIHKAVQTKKNGIGVFHYNDLSKLHQKLRHYCQAGDVILVKASRSIGLERTVDYLNKSLRR